MSHSDRIATLAKSFILHVEWSTTVILPTNYAAILHNRGPGFIPPWNSVGKHTWNFSCRFHGIPCEILHGIFIPCGQRHTKATWRLRGICHMFLRTWYENYMDYFTRNLMESAWNFICFPRGIPPWGVKPGPLSCMIANGPVLQSVCCASVRTITVEQNDIRRMIFGMTVIY